MTTLGTQIATHNQSNVITYKLSLLKQCVDIVRSGKAIKRAFRTVSVRDFHGTHDSDRLWHDILALCLPMSPAANLIVDEANRLMEALDDLSEEYRDIKHRL